MKILSTALLCISIIGSVGGSAYYLKQEPKTLIETNYGSVNLGQVFAESVLMTVEIDGFSGHQDYDVVLNQWSFFEAKKDLNEAMERKMKLIFIDSPESEKISYDIATVTSDRDVVITTAIRYNSSNFMNQPYILTMSKKTYKIKKDEPLKSSLDKFVDDAIAINKKDIANRLYITNKELYGLLVEKDPKS